MGISGLLGLLKSIQKPCTLESFAGQTLGVDAYGWLHRSVVPCAIDLAMEKPTKKFVDYFVNRVRMLRHFGVTPYLVFDGDFLPSKEKTEEHRASRRLESRSKGLELLRIGKTSQAHTELQKAIDVTPEMARLVIDTLRSLKIQYVVAPFEADPQLAYLEKKGIIDGVLSEDSDLLVFGVNRLITKLDQYGNCIQICRTDFTACREISLVGWSDADFRRMAILSGCDYLSGINQMGLKTAYRYLRKHKTVERVVRAIQFEGRFKVPPNYLERFRDAELTFLHQWVFCPDAQDMMHLTKLEQPQKASELYFIGHKLERDIACGVARGDLNPHTKKPFLTNGRLDPSQGVGKISRKLKVLDSKDSAKSKATIQSFFLAKRAPLAELDLNSLHQLTPRLSSGVPGLTNNESRSRVSLSPVRADLGFDTPRQSSQPCQKLTTPHTISALSDHSVKRKRLFSDHSPVDWELRGVETGKSKFFPLKKAKNLQEEVKIWSDDLGDGQPTAMPSAKPSKTRLSVSDRIAPHSHTTFSTVSSTSYSRGPGPRHVPTETLCKVFPHCSDQSKDVGQLFKHGFDHRANFEKDPEPRTIRIGSRSKQVRNEPLADVALESGPEGSKRLDFNVFTLPKFDSGRALEEESRREQSNVHVLVEASPQGKASFAGTCLSSKEICPKGSEDLIISESEDESTVQFDPATRRYPNFEEFLYKGT